MPKPKFPAPRKFTVAVLYEVEGNDRAEVEQTWREALELGDLGIPAQVALDILVVAADAAALVNTINQPIMALEALAAVARQKENNGSQANQDKDPRRLRQSRVD